MKVYAIWSQYGPEKSRLTANKHIEHFVEDVDGSARQTEVKCERSDGPVTKWRLNSNEPRLNEGSRMHYVALMDIQTNVAFTVSGVMGQ